MADFFDGMERELRKLYYGWEGAEQFIGTASRVRRMTYKEFCWPSDKINAELEKCFKAIFMDDYSEMLVKGPIEVWTLCPHHLMPCKFKVYVGYVPNERVLGLSKFSRVAVILGRRPVMQEMYSKELAEVILTNLKPRGVGVFVIGEHGCMKARGVQQDANVTTSVLKGVIYDRPEVRAEFYSIVRGGNRAYE